MMSLASRIDIINELFGKADTGIKVYNALVRMRQILGDEMFDTLEDKGGAKLEYQIFWDNVVSKIQPYLEDYDVRTALTSVPFNAGPQVRELFSNKINEIYGLADKHEDYMAYLKGAKEIGKCIELERSEIENMFNDEVHNAVPGLNGYRTTWLSLRDLAKGLEGDAEDDVVEGLSVLSDKFRDEAKKMQEEFLGKFNLLVNDYGFKFEGFDHLKDDLEIKSDDFWYQYHDKHMFKIKPRHKRFVSSKDDKHG